MMSNRPALARAGARAPLCAVLCVPLTCATSLAGTPVSAPTPAPSPAQLAALAFPGWSEGRTGRLQSVDLPAGAAGAGGAHGGHASWHPGANRVLVDPRLALRIDAGHLTLVAGLVPAGENGKPSAAQSAPMALAAYQFELQGGAWRVAGRQGIFAFRGFSGAAALHAVTLSSRRQGVAVEYGSCWDGYCGTWLALYEVEQDAVRREPAVELALSGVNVDGADDCARRLQPLLKSRAPDTAVRDDHTPSDPHDCYAIEGSWTIEAARGAHGAPDAPGALVLHYQGAISRADAHAAAPVAIDQRQVLRYGAGKYRAVSGFNPVPPI